MFVQIGAMTSLEIGRAIFDILKTDEKVEFIFIESGRSNDLFEGKQFGEFGEAAAVTVIAIQKHQDELFEKIFELADLKNQDQGIISTNTHLISALNEL